jgi:hypothetical protein
MGGNVRTCTEGRGRLRRLSAEVTSARTPTGQAPGTGGATPTPWRRLATLVCALALVLTAGTAHAAGENGVAEGPSATGWELGFRTGVIFPAGELSPGAALSIGVGVEFPIIIDIGYRLNRHLFLGVVGQYAIGTVGSGSCPSGQSCLVMNGRIGPELQVHPLGRTGRVDPWFGLGFGYEWQLYSISGSGSSDTLTVSGFDFLNVDIGVDFPVGKVHLGPYVGFTLGQYDHASDSTMSDSIDAKALHYWFSVGIKLTVFP